MEDGLEGVSMVAGSPERPLVWVPYTVHKREWDWTRAGGQWTGHGGGQTWGGVVQKRAKSSGLGDSRAVSEMGTQRKNKFGGRC